MIFPILRLTKKKRLLNLSASSVSCVTERLSGCKDTDLYWIRANYYLKKYYSTVAFFDNFNRTTSCITVNELQTMGNVNMVYII
jgi:hypothetical protein